MTEAALVLVCKRPASGIGKQRLAASVGGDAASRIAEALLACALEDARAWPGQVVIAPADPADHAWASALLPQAQAQLEIRVEAQAEGNLGQRLNTLDHKLRAGGLEQLVYIGSDAPLLAAPDYAAVYEALMNYDTVLKPAADGGVVLMANRQRWPALSSLPWSTARLGAALANCCRSAGQSVVNLTQSFDVDEEDDVIRLIEALNTDQRPARRALHGLACDLARWRERSHVQF
ncbi:DUF2064 domain-containing protein [Nitrosospira sp. NRS527]|uniref:TIGR04282 family arsenosugar biosynthesis glycosyltransferase n=1 Tax=Nitrosospira sp. NRS527 TaxID=155925 RepID=UPI001AF2CCFD|nr:DUF2064 domain-containing protein [Nitrosospira sp. NRS527]BCT69367.1 hypothetical protein NNRS527_02988 [Nitrosospira sp. NRS527]